MRKKNPILLKVGENIRRLRQNVNLSQEGLAAEAELDRTYIGGVERGERNLSLLNLVKIAKALNESPSTLLNGISTYERPESPLLRVAEPRNENLKNG